MKRTYEISTGHTGVISTGEFENEKPSFFLKESTECDHGEFLTDEDLKERLNELQSVCREQFSVLAHVSYMAKIARTYQNIRFYDVDDSKYPSVTSIIGWDADFHVTPDELIQYAARGTIIDKQVQIYLETKEWKQPKVIPEIYPDLVTLKGGNLNLAVDNVNFIDFYKEYPFKVIALQKTVFNHELKYAGTLDIKCIIESENKGKWEKMEGIIYDVPTILDVKSGAINKVKMFEQQTAYWRCEDDVKQVGLIHLNKETKQGYSKPIMLSDPEKYWHLFRKDLHEFKKRYGL